MFQIFAQQKNISTVVGLRESDFEEVINNLHS
jgi:hypothetical protein